jgi:hypothetical protein
MNLTDYHTEDSLIFATITDDGQVLEEDTAKKLLSIPGQMMDLTEAIALSP